MTEQKDNFQLNKKWLGRGLVISCTINQDGDMIALSYDHDKVVAQNSDWLEREQPSWKEKGNFQRSTPETTASLDCFRR